MRGPSPHRQSDRGITLIEMMVVLAIAGMMMLVGYRALQSVTDSELRAQANKVMAVLRMAHSGASATGKHVRVVFDLEQQKFWMEICEGDARLEKAEDEEKVVDADDLEDLQEKITRAQKELEQQGRSTDHLAQVLQASSPEKAVEAAAALQGLRLGSSTCTPSADPMLADRAKREEVPIGVLPPDLGVTIRRIYVKHLEDAVEEGRVSFNFFPLGFAERGIVEVAHKDGEVFSLLVHATTGKVEIRRGAVEDVDDFMLRNAIGDTEETREAR